MDRNARKRAERLGPAFGRLTKSQQAEVLELRGAAAKRRFEELDSARRSKVRERSWLRRRTLKRNEGSRSLFWTVSFTIVHTDGTKVERAIKIDSDHKPSRGEIYERIMERVNNPAVWSANYQEGSEPEDGALVKKIVIDKIWAPAGWKG